MQYLLSMGHILPPVRAQLISRVSDLSVLKGLETATYMKAIAHICKLSSIVQFQEDQYTSVDSVEAEG